MRTNLNKKTKKEISKRKNLGAICCGYNTSQIVSKSIEVPQPKTIDLEKKELYRFAISFDLEHEISNTNIHGNG